MAKPKMSLEYRIWSSPEKERETKEHWDNIEGMAERKQEVLERCRREREERKARR